MAKNASKKLKESKVIFQSPSISRFIPEFIHSSNPFYLKIVAVSFISGFLLMAISMKGYQLINTVQEIRSAHAQRVHLSEELNYWQSVTQDHSGYRDAYFKVALLAYQLGDKEKARKNLIEALAIDPTFKEGRVFGESTGLL